MNQIIQKVYKFQFNVIYFINDHKSNCKVIRNGLTKKIFEINKTMFSKMNMADDNLSNKNHIFCVYKNSMDNIIKIEDDFIVNFNQKCNEFCYEATICNCVSMVDFMSDVLNDLNNLIQNIISNLQYNDFIQLKFKCIEPEIMNQISNHQKIIDLFSKFVKHIESQIANTKSNFC